MTARGGQRRREPLTLEVVDSDEAVDAPAFLRQYVALLLTELRREDADAPEDRGPVEEEPAHETPDDEIPPERRFGLLAFI